MQHRREVSGLNPYLGISLLLHGALLLLLPLWRLPDSSIPGNSLNSGGVVQVMSLPPARRPAKVQARQTGESGGGPVVKADAPKKVAPPKGDVPAAKPTRSQASPTVGQLTGSSGKWSAPSADQQQTASISQAGKATAKPAETDRTAQKGDPAPNERIAESGKADGSTSAGTPTGEDRVVAGQQMLVGELGSPSYPKNAQNADVEGQVVVLVQVGADGKTLGSEVTHTKLSSEGPEAAKLAEFAKRFAEERIGFKAADRPYAVPVTLLFIVQRDEGGYKDYRVEPRLGNVQFAKDARG